MFDNILNALYRVVLFDFFYWNRQDKELKCCNITIPTNADTNNIMDIFGNKYSKPYKDDMKDEWVNTFNKYTDFILDLDDIDFEYIKSHDVDEEEHEPTEHENELIHTVTQLRDELHSLTSELKYKWEEE